MCNKCRSNKTTLKYKEFQLNEDNCEIAATAAKQRNIAEKNIAHQGKNRFRVFFIFFSFFFLFFSFFCPNLQLHSACSQITVALERVWIVSYDFNGTHESCILSLTTLTTKLWNIFFVFNNFNNETLKHFFIFNNFNNQTLKHFILFLTTPSTKHLFNFDNLNTAS